MNEDNKIQLFEGQQVRYVWDSEKEKYFFSVIDVIKVLTDTDRPRKYWSDLKHKLESEGSEVYEKIVQLKLPAPDGKMPISLIVEAMLRTLLASNWNKNWEIPLSPVSVL